MHRWMWRVSVWNMISQADDRLSVQSFNLQLRQIDVKVALLCQQQQSVSVSPKHVNIHISHVCHQCDTVGEGANNVQVSILHSFATDTMSKEWWTCSLTTTRRLVFWSEQEKQDFAKIKYSTKFPDLYERLRLWQNVWWLLTPESLIFSATDTF